MTPPRNDPSKERFAALVIGGASIAEAATALGVSPKTGNRWRHDPIVEAAFEQYRQELRANTSSRLAELGGLAMDRAKDLLLAPDTPPQVIARLLGLVLAESRQWIEAEEVLRRLDRLEALATADDEDEPLTKELARHEA